MENNINYITTLGDLKSLLARAINHFGEDSKVVFEVHSHSPTEHVICAPTIVSDITKSLFNNKIKIVMR